MISTNRPFREWGKLFNVDNMLATVLIDRLMYHGERIVVQGDSLRMKDKNPDSTDEWHLLGHKHLADQGLARYVHLESNRGIQPSRFLKEGLSCHSIQPRKRSLNSGACSVR